MCRSAKPPEGFRDVRDGRAPARGGRVSPTGSAAVSARSTIAATLPAAVTPPTGPEVASTTPLRERFSPSGGAAEGLERLVGPGRGGGMVPDRPVYAVAARRRRRIDS